MLYKILLTLNASPNLNLQYSQAAEKLTQNNWKIVHESNNTWVSEIIANDLLSAKIRVERDLQSFFQATGLLELSYAFQLSLGEVSTGKLKSVLV
jgi:hypothetical protein